MSVDASKRNPLLPRLGNIGNLEHTIEFESEPTSQPSRIRASESTIRWCNDLNTRKVQYLQLCKEGAQYHAIITLEDGSIFQLKLAQARNRENPSSVCDLIRLPKDSRLLSMCLFSIEGAGDVACPVSDIKFIVAMCLPLCQKLDPTRTSHGTLFALTLTIAVARKCVDINSECITSTGTPLDAFWKDVISSTKSINQPLWEEAMISSIRNQVRNWVFLQAREHVAGRIFRHGQESDFPSPAESAGATEVQQSLEPPSTQSIPAQTEIHPKAKDKRERTSATSIVAWLEFFSSKQMATSLALWDSAWSSTWEKKWGKSWTKCWTQQQGENNSIVVKPIHIPLTSGRVSGKIAGKIPIDTNMFKLMVKMPANSLLEWEYKRTIALQSHGFLENGVIGGEVAWFESWRYLRYPNPLESCCPSWELAVVMAWVLRWEGAVELGRRRAQTNLCDENSQRRIVGGTVTVSRLESQPEEHMSTGAPQTGEVTATTAVEPRNPLHPRMRSQLANITQFVGQLKARYMSRILEKPYIPNQADQVSRDYVLKRVVDFAWDIASKTPEGPEFELNLSSAALSAFSLTKKNFGNQFASRTSATTLPKDKWMLVFKSAWEETWKECWRMSWETVMKESEKIVLARGIQEGISSTRDDEDRNFAQEADLYRTSTRPIGRLEPTIILSHSAQSSLRKIRDVMLYTSPTVDYRRCVPSIFVDLEQIYRAMSHSSPVAHPRMEIKMFKEKSSLTAIVYAKSKTKGFWDQKAEEDKFQVVPHADFQHRMRCIIGGFSEQELGLGKSPIEWMTEVWQEVVAISSSMGGDFVPEINEPEHVFRTLTFRAPMSSSSQQINVPDSRETLHSSANRRRNWNINLGRVSFQKSSWNWEKFKRGLLYGQTMDSEEAKPNRRPPPMGEEVTGPNEAQL